VSIVRLTKASADPTESLRPAGRKIKRIRTSVGFVKDSEEAVSRTQVQCQIRAHLKLVLDVAVYLGFAESHDGLSARKTGAADLVIHKRINGGKRNLPVFGASLVLW